MKSDRQILALIPARGGSKGVPRKNVRPLAGKPLIAYAIEVARASSLIDRTIVSTDDGEIANVARQYGAEVPFLRPAELARDDTPEWQVWQHTLRFVEAERGLPDVLVCVSPTSPLRTAEDVDACIRALLDSNADVAFAVKPAERNPYFNMVTLNDAGYARLVIPTAQPVHRRQSAPVVYDMTTVAYAARPRFVLSADAMFEGKTRAVIVPAERALDIDTELDFRLAEFLMSEAKG